MAFTIAQISDTHLSRAKPFFVPGFQAIGEALRAARPDLVINTGDLSLNGAEDDDDLAFAQEQHAALGLRWRAIPGNHDVGDNVGIDSDHQHPIDAERHGRYHARFGADHWRLDIPGWRLLAVNAQAFGSELSTDQEKLLSEAGGTADRKLALFIHKPLCDKALDETVVGGRFLNPVPRGRLFAALERVVK